MTWKLMVLALAGAGSVVAAQSNSPIAKPSIARPDEMAVIGCIELEKDYRARMNQGKGGPLGTGGGQDNEFVLTDTRPATEAAHTAKGMVAGGGVYSLTGGQEDNLKRNIGRRVEIVGVLENAGKPSTGADARNVPTLPRLVIKTWHTVADFCPKK
jgi:hypothetical protein